MDLTRNRLLCQLFLLLSAVSVVLAEVNVIPSPALAFTYPCGNNPRWFVQNYVVKDGINDWNGIFYLDQFRHVYSVRLEVVLEYPAKITLKNTMGSILTEDNQTFLISTFKAPPEIRRVEFQVTGLIPGFFPHFISLRFNDDPLCDNTGRDLSAPFLKKSPKCGKRKVGPTQGLIANSYEASPGTWPWHAALYHMRDEQPVYQCGGTLISPRMVLTAAHCMFGSNGGVVTHGDLLVHLGKNLLDTVDENTKEFRVARAILHQGYSRSTFANDIALLKLENDVEFTKYIQPVCLFDELPKQSVFSLKGYVVGWGYTEENNKPANHLREAQMPVIDTAQCLLSNRGFFGELLSTSNFCAGYRNGTSVCSGDSGGGMFVNLNGLWKIRGLVSVGVRHQDENSKCNPSNYVLFTDVLRFIDWIDERIDL